jgi:hypothetical protein
MQIPARRPKRKRAKKRGFFAISPPWNDRKRRFSPSGQPLHDRGASPDSAVERPEIAGNRTTQTAAG